ncbi:ABC transporter permease, partial [Alkalihalophilus lindianensis]|nr:ABC transporter permease [Alkalihalophilus lindianensis]
LYGGISPGQVLVVLGYYIFTILVFGSIGIFFSTLVRKTIIAMITTYGVTLFLTAGTAFLFAVSMSVSQMGNSSNNPFALFFVMLNPVMILFSFLGPDAFSELSNQLGLGSEFPLWAANMVTYVLIMVLLIFISVKKLRPNMKVKS